MSDPTREEFARAVTAAVTSVRHLYLEVQKLGAEITDLLGGEPMPFTGLGQPLSRQVGIDDARIRHFFGQLFEPGAAEHVDDEPEDDEESGEDDEGEEEGRRRTRRTITIFPDRCLLAVKLVLFDPAESEGFEPQLQYGICSDWSTVRSKSRPQDGEGYVVLRSDLPGLLTAFDPRLLDGKRERVVSGVLVRGRGKGRELSFRMPAMGRVWPLYDLDGVDAVLSLVREMKDYWRSTTAGA